MHGEPYNQNINGYTVDFYLMDLALIKIRISFNSYHVRVGHFSFVYLVGVAMWV